MTNANKDSASCERPSLDLKQILADVWSHLERGVEHAKEPFHVGVLGTYSGRECSLRTVVLRGVKQGGRELLCHTDCRSPKITDITAHPRVSWLFYDPARKLQLRLTGQAAVRREGPVVDKRWEDTSLSARRCYLATNAPGTPATTPTSGLAHPFECRPPTRAESTPGRMHFAVIATVVEEIDWLWLNARGHRRARFEWRGEQLTAQWVVP